MKLLIRFAVFSALCIATPPILHAQLVVAAPPPLRADASPGAKHSGNAAHPLYSINSALRRGSPLIQRGGFALRPHIRYRMLYADGLLNAGQAESGNSIIQTISAGLLLELGKHWNFDYGNTQTLYSNEFLTDSSDHFISLSGGYSFENWTLGATQTYSLDSPTLVETADQTRRESYSTEVNTRYQFSQKLMSGLVVTRNVRNADADATAPEWTTDDWESRTARASVHYHLSNRLQLSASYTYGYDDLRRGADMEFSRPQVQLSWRPIDKVSLSVEAGTERRRFRIAGGNNLESPLYNGSLQYSPLPTTSVSISASRSVSASYFANQATRSRSWSIAIEQRLFRRYFVTLNASNYETNYVSAADLGLTRRIDDGSIIGFRVGTALLARGTLALFYQQGHNSSNSTAFDFTSHQVGIETSYSF